MEIILVVLYLASVLAGGPSASAPSDTQWEQAGTQIAASRVSSVSCGQYADIIKRSSRNSTAYLNDSANVLGDVYVAGEYKARRRSLPSRQSTTLRASLITVTARALDDVMEGDTFDPELGEVQSRALQLCALQKKAASALKYAHRSDQRTRKITTLARRMPWYPRGFKGASSEAAMRWRNNTSCGIKGLGGYCWGMDVVTRNDCPSMLYVEASILDGGKVIGFTNDTVGSIDAGQIAEVELQFFESGRGSLTAHISHVNCY